LPPEGPAPHPGTDEGDYRVAELAVQLGPDPGVARVDPADGGGRLGHGAAKGDGPAAGQRVGGRQHGVAEPEPEGAQITAGDGRGHHGQGQEAGAQVVAEAG
jgi:hypothetical protein